MFIKVKIQNIKIICPFSPSEGTTLSKDSYNIQNSKTELLSPQIDTESSVKLPGGGGGAEGGGPSRGVGPLTTGLCV